MAQHEILVTLSVSDREYIALIKAQQESGKHTVQSYLRSLLMDAIPSEKPKKKKVKVKTNGSVTDEPMPIAKIKKKYLKPDSPTSADIMAHLKSDTAPISGGEAEPAPAPSTLS